MVKKSDIEITVESQAELFAAHSDLLNRELDLDVNYETLKHAVVISGIRRCGKSTLLSQILKELKGKNFFINFDTPRLFNFEISDFEVLDLVIREGAYENLFFDEIQVVEGWELYVRQKLDEGFKVFVTGSNASLLSQELGTKLTGRHLTKELFPFSYSEFLSFKALENDAESLAEYLEKGGFPEYLTVENDEVIVHLFEDILFRDIAVRYGVRDVAALKRLIIYLISNASKLVTASKLKQAIGVKNASTIMDYFNYFEQSYLVSFLPKFSYSYRAQLINPRKVYIIDNGLINTVSSSFSEDLGRKFENMIFQYLRQHHKELYYFNENDAECDFVVFSKKKPTVLIQACYDLNVDNAQREQNGLWQAMEFFDLDEAYILTMNQSDIIKKGNKKIIVEPAYKYLMSHL